MAMAGLALVAVVLSSCGGDAAAGPPSCGALKTGEGFPMAPAMPGSITHNFSGNAG